MTGPELRETLIELFGESWAQSAPEIIGVHRTSLYRQISGQTPVQPTLAWGLENMRLLESYRQRHNRGQANWRNKVKTTPTDAEGRRMFRLDPPKITEEQDDG